MIFPGHYNAKQGMLLLDILLAMSLGVLFISFLAQNYLAAQDMLAKAKNKSIVLDQFEKEQFFSTSSLYGRDMIQTNFTSASSSMEFVGVISEAKEHAAGSPWCSADFQSDKVIGSYSFGADKTTILKTAKIQQIMLPVDANIPLTDLEVRNGVAYISADSATQSDADLFIVDISNQKIPRLLSSINTGPGIASIALSGNKIYAAALSTAAQLHVITIGGLNNISLERKYQVTPPYATATLPLGSSIAYKNGAVYLGTTKWDGEEILLFNVLNSDITKIFGLEVGSKVNFLNIAENTFYVSASGEKQLLVVGFSTSTGVAVTTSFSPSGWQRQEGKVTDMFEDSLVFGRTTGGFNLPVDHEIFNWSGIASSSLNNLVSSDLPGGVYGILTDKNFFYIVTRNLDHELQILDKNMALVAIYPLPIAPQVMTCDQNIMYVLAHNAPAIYEITF